MRSPKIIPIALTAFVATTCAPDAPLEIDKVERGEQIDQQNDPRLFGLRIHRNFDELPTSGESAQKPFPSNWWPMRSDGIARRWLGEEPSPAEKYDLLMTPELIRSVELTHARVNTDGEPVNVDLPPETFQVGPAAEWELRRHGRFGGVEPEGWWGHCNGWAAYALNEQEPLHAVLVRYDRGRDRISECREANEAGCVRFEVGDINALGAELYFHDAARLIGRRCEENRSEFALDENGRLEDIRCRDGNPGSFHTIMTNMIGILTRPVILDISADEQVWNYPAYAFELTRNEEVSLLQALIEIETPSTSSTSAVWNYNPAATRFVRVTMVASIVEDAVPPTTYPMGDQVGLYTTREQYDYILELDEAGVILGGEWVGNSKTWHPDFLWFSLRSATNQAGDDLDDGDNPALRYSIFKQILKLSRSPQDGSPNAEDAGFAGNAAPLDVLPDDAGVPAASPDADVSAEGAMASLDATATATITP